MTRWEDGFADSDGVKIHYVTAGKGPLCVLIHGFPDFWFTWRAQMPALSEHVQVVAIDQRGYNLSDKPEGVENYRIDKLVGDVVAVLRHFRAEKAIIVGHDWGGLVAWTFAMQHPEKTDRLVILNLPHPQGLLRELANNPEQQKNSQYARDFQKSDAASKLTPEMLTFWVRDQGNRNTSKRCGGRRWKGCSTTTRPTTRANRTVRAVKSVPKVKCPVLMIHGLKDKALLPGALNDTWDWMDNDLTLVTIPEADHFVQQDAAEKVTKTMVGWLTP